MKRLIGHTLSGALGIVICVGIVMLSDAFHLVPRIPAPGGEDDFAFRAALFFFGVCPAFAALGVWINILSESSAGAAIRSWMGAVLASFLVLVSARFVRARLEGLVGDGEGNQAAALLFALWVVAAAAGAYFLRSRRSQ